MKNLASQAKMGHMSHHGDSKGFQHRSYMKTNYRNLENHFLHGTYVG